MADYKYLNVIVESPNEGAIVGKEYSKSNGNNVILQNKWWRIATVIHS